MALAICIWEVLSRRFLIEKIFSLILVFVYLAYALLLAGLEFLSLVILLLYVGAIAVLFLFVIMILNPDYHLLLEEEKDLQMELDAQPKPVEEESSFFFHTFLPMMFGGLFSYTVILTTVIIPFFRRPPSTPEFLPDGSPAPFVYVLSESKKYAPWHIHKENMTLVELGDILYTMYGVGVFIIGACLLVAMISSILLCVHRTLKLKRQNISKQAKRYK
jgi:NADH:ubiquinone oxidoreductase subunit 6 (subunit J)